MKDVEKIASPPYKSRFEDWDERATVRRKPRRVLQDEDAMGKVFFPRGLLPIVDHPLVQELGPEVEREILIRHLYGYLDFTTYLEHELVNSAAHRIAARDTDFDLPDGMLFDAFKLYTDEAYHALFSEDLKRQVSAATGVRQVDTSCPAFLAWCRELKASHHRELSGLYEIFFAIVAETLISATLVQVPRDKQVVTAVRELVADHAEDEAFHFGYFSSLFKIVWPQLTGKQKEVIGPLLPPFILKFLRPNYAGLRRNLAETRLDEEQIEKVIEDSYSEERVLEEVRRTARVPLRLFEEYVVRGEPRAADAFEASGLLVSPASSGRLAAAESPKRRT